MNPIEQFQQVSVLVPVGRIPEFYEMYGRWLAHGPEVVDVVSKPAQNTGPVKFADGTMEAVAAWWEILTMPAKRIFLLLAETPGVPYTGGEIAEACEIENGASGVAGSLSWPGKFARDRFGLELPLNWDKESQKYSMDADAAALILQAHGRKRD
jgi:hypothetical protein